MDKFHIAPIKFMNHLGFIWEHFPTLSFSSVSERCPFFVLSYRLIYSENIVLLVFVRHLISTLHFFKSAWMFENPGTYIVPILRPGITKK